MWLWHISQLVSTLGSQINDGVLKSEGVETLCKIKKPNKWGGGGWNKRGEGVGNFDKIKRKGLFVNETQFYQ